MAKIVQDVMMPEPVTVDAEMSIKAAAHLMRTWDVREVLVVENGKVRGLLTDADIVVIAIAAGRHPASIPAGECCDPDVPVLSADVPAEKAAKLMSEHRRRRLPVVDHQERLIGTVWASDLDPATSSH
jgi:CBS domain-containing protein